MIATVATQPNAGVVAAPSPERQAFGALAKSLRRGDVDGANEAYANLVRNAPEGATWPKGSHFADLGMALVKGDMDAARTAFASMVKDKVGTLPPVKGGPIVAPSPVPSTTGGDAGSLINVVA